MIDPSATISLFFTDPVTSGSVIVGNLFHGPVTGSSITEIGEMITYTSPLGEYAGGGVLTVGSGLDIDVSAGTGYISQGSYPNQTLQKIAKRALYYHIYVIRRPW